VRNAKPVLMLLIMAVLLVFASGCGAQGSVEGHVYAGKDLLPVSGAKIVCTGVKSSAQTDANGYFRIDGIKIGTQTLTVADGLLSAQKSVLIVKDQMTPVNIVFDGSLPLDSKKWTVLVYLASDNNLHYEGINDLNEMKAVGSNEDFNIVVQYDGWYAGDSERLYIKPGEALSLERLGEVDMSKGFTLEEFVEWGLTNFPAENTMLVLWNHGGGVWPRSIGGRGLEEAAGTQGSADGGGFASGGGGGGGDSSIVQPSGIAWDDSSNSTGPWNCLTTDELRIALERANEAVPEKKIDIIDFDACLMQMYEVCLELEGLADYTVGSEEVTPGGGNPYTDILALLEANPDITAADFAKGIADEFMDSYSPVGFNGLAQSVIKISGPEWNEFKAAMEAFGAALAGLSATEMQAFRDRIAGDYVYQEDVFAGDLDVSPVLRFDYPENADLGWIVQAILDIDNAAHLPVNLQLAAADLQDRLETVVLHTNGNTGASKYGVGSYEAAGGMAIMMPRGYDDWKFYKEASQYVMLKVGTTSWYGAIQKIVPTITSGETLTVTVRWENGNLDLYSYEPHGSWYKYKSAFSSSSPNGTFTANVSSPNLETTVSETYTLKTTYEKGRYVFYVYCSGSNGAPINARIQINDAAEVPITLSETVKCHIFDLQL